MNEVILELANKIKSSVKSNQGSANTCIPNNELLSICNEIERINSLKPIGYMSVTGVENIHDCGSSTVHEESDDKRNIPVYIQY
ncbi:hypothetical protein [Providencia alcalifaciens]|uniref:hypothetical protein n=1 Tax=Providencia alcalifaciens TaxID=126385 RepID=UPI001CC510C5|nr:hypothetical protein [Providencia alcalifaciens]CAG9415954.1 hypothetical protein NVI2019_GHJFPKLH_01325 [Providencia alcalifaciens]